MSDAIEAALLPCPWCGGKALPPMYSVGRWFCRCGGDCGTPGPSFWQGGPNATIEEQDHAKREAIAAWNRRPALTAYEAAKGGGVAEGGSSAADYIRGLLGLCQMIAGRDDCPPAIREVLAHNHRYADALKFATYRIRSALTSPASGERDAVIEECAKVAEAEELTGDAPSHFTQHEIDIVTATVRSTARSIATAIRALRMEGK